MELVEFRKVPKCADGVPRALKFEVGMRPHVNYG